MFDLNNSNFRQIFNKYLVFLAQNKVLKGGKRGPGGGLLEFVD